MCRRCCDGLVSTAEESDAGLLRWREMMGVGGGDVVEALGVCCDITKHGGERGDCAPSTRAEDKHREWDNKVRRRESSDQRITLTARCSPGTFYVSRYMRIGVLGRTAEGDESLSGARTGRSEMLDLSWTNVEQAQTRFSQVDKVL